MCSSLNCDNWSSAMIFCSISYLLYFWSNIKPWYFTDNRKKFSIIFLPFLDIPQKGSLEIQKTCFMHTPPWTTYLSDMIIVMFPSFWITYHIECSMSGLKYIPFLIISPDSNTWTSTDIFYWWVYVKSVNWTIW